MAAATEEGMAGLLSADKAADPVGGQAPRSPVSNASILAIAAYGVVAGVYAGVLPAPTRWAWYSWHPLSMTVAFVSLTASAALIKKRGGYENTKRHGNLMAAAVALALFGWYVIYTNKALLGKPHVTSWHALGGVVALVAYAALFGVGLLGLHPDLGAVRADKRVRAVHKWGGRAAAGCGWLVCVVGFSNKHEGVLERLCFAVPLFFAASVVFSTE